jgi:sec-independent protein translocase protein TatB
MFDVGFSELVLVGIVALLVIGPEQLPETVRTTMGWINRIRRGFNEIKQEVQQELHNDAVMRELRQTSSQLKQETEALGREFSDPLVAPVATQPEPTTPVAPVTPPPEASRSEAQDRISQNHSTPETRAE